MRQRHLCPLEKPHPCMSAYLHYQMALAAAELLEWLRLGRKEAMQGVFCVYVVDRSIDVLAIHSSIT